MFQDAILDGSGYCGPTSLSAVTGFGTKRLCKALRLITGKAAIKGLPVSGMDCFLKKFGLSARGRQRPPERVTLAKFQDWHTRKGVAYLVNVTGHYLVIRDDRVCCTQFRGKVSALADSKYLRSNVKNFWVIDGVFDRNAFDKYANQYDRPKVREVPEHVKQSRFRRNLNVLAKSMGLKIDLTDDDEPYQTTVWVYLPDSLIEDHFSGNDPFDGNHCFADWQEAFDAVYDLVKENPGLAAMTAGK